MIAEPNTDTFAATNTTRTLADAGSQACIRHNFDTVGPVYQELPNFLARNKYQDIADVANTPFQAAFKTDVPSFAWMAAHPEAVANFNKFMEHRKKSSPTWLDVFPMAEETKSADPNGVFFVDIGGGMGHMCQALRAKYPDLKGRVILQDLPQAIDMALQTPGVENTVHDFFTPQPVKNAKFYYLKIVLHDWPDPKAREIFRNIIPAMGKDSVILVDEMQFPVRNVHRHATAIDLTMMAVLAGFERTRSQWDALLDSVGLKIASTFTYTPSLYESVMVVTRK